MCSKQIVTLLVVAVVSTFAEPPSSYGPPGFSSSGPAKTSFSSGGGSGGGSGSGGSSTFFSGGEGGAPEPYSYAYEVKDAPTGNDYSSQATSDGKRVQGEYRVLLPDGRRQIVKYTADDGGYNANVVYEGQARYPAQVAKTVSSGNTVSIASTGGSTGGGSTIVAGGSSTGGSFGGYRY